MVVDVGIVGKLPQEDQTWQMMAAIAAGGSLFGRRFFPAEETAPTDRAIGEDQVRRSSNAQLSRCCVHSGRRSTGKIDSSPLRARARPACLACPRCSLPPRPTRTGSTCLEILSRALRCFLSLTTQAIKLFHLKHLRSVCPMHGSPFSSMISSYEAWKL